MVVAVIPVLYPATERTFQNNGLGGLPDAITCAVTEKRNTPGGYYLEMDYPCNGLHFSDLAPERIIYAAPAPGKGPQPFYIERITEAIDGIVHIEAPHISSRMQKIVTYGRTVSQNPEAVWYTLTQIAISIGQQVDFTWLRTDILSDVAKTIDFRVPTQLSEILVGSEGSIIDTYGGELEFDGWDIILHSQRGVDSGIEIRYGVNMTQLDAETDASDLVTAVLPYWKGRVNDTDTVVYGDLCTSSNASAYATIRAIPFDATQKIGSDSQPTKAQVTAAGQAYINSTATTDLSMSITTSFAPALIGDRPLYLCDTVKVVHPDLGVSSTAKVVETRFNVLTGQYESITIGSIRKSIVDTIADIIKK